MCPWEKWMNRVCIRCLTWYQPGYQTCDFLVLIEFCCSSFIALWSINVEFVSRRFHRDSRVRASVCFASLFPDRVWFFFRLQFWFFCSWMFLVWDSWSWLSFDSAVSSKSHLLCLWIVDTILFVEYLVCLLLLDYYYNHNNYYYNNLSISEVESCCILT